MPSWADWSCCGWSRAPRYLRIGCAGSLGSASSWSKRRAPTRITVLFGRKFAEAVGEWAEEAQALLPGEQDRTGPRRPASRHALELLLAGPGSEMARDLPASAPAAARAAVRRRPAGEPHRPGHGPLVAAGLIARYFPETGGRELEQIAPPP